ncbi:hypothetical protein BJ912DRAFT_976953 [Pholiota molesta]|nr:hypothetical protein BJ912DRAFT_978758 [Pholiota molesta]KAF8183201.1 hypothetical protein BJ912DRAFT_976953 [Pholiota molesta]
MLMLPSFADWLWHTIQVHHLPPVLASCFAMLSFIELCRTYALVPRPFCSLCLNMAHKPEFLSRSDSCPPAGSLCFEMASYVQETMSISSSADALSQSRSVQVSTHQKRPIPSSALPVLSLPAIVTDVSCTIARIWNKRESCGIVDATLFC